MGIVATGAAIYAGAGALVHVIALVLRYREYPNTKFSARRHALLFVNGVVFFPAVIWQMVADRLPSRKREVEETLQRYRARRDMDEVF